MKKKEEKRKRISRADRLMAIKRLPEFKKDYQDYLKIRKKGDQTLIIEKIVELYKKWGEEIPSIENAENIYYNVTKKGENPSFCIKVVYSIEKNPVREYALGNGEKITKRWIEGDRLYLEVDMRNANRGELIKDFKRIIDEYDDILPGVRGTRKRKTKVDHWEVWNTYQKNKNLQNVTRKIFDVKGKLYKDFGEGLYKQVVRAYNRAENIIKSVKSS